MILFLFVFSGKTIIFLLEETKFESPLSQITIHQSGIVLNSSCDVHCLAEIIASFRHGWDGRDGRVLLVRPLRIPRWIPKILFVLGCYELLVMLQGKIRKGLLF